eukprot:c13867_g1_i2.p1 GENE.c13867_g1_i2~~c13867_g1_i2.p1  ORF type:complete len:488 (+),score=66.13 c13867_g1_i2:42-1505(+)
MRSHPHTSPPMAHTSFSTHGTHDTFDSFPNPDSVHFLKAAFIESHPFPQTRVVHSRKASQATRSLFCGIPNDILEHHIVPHLDPASICSLSLVCKPALQATASDFLWRSLFKSRWPHHGPNPVNMSWRSNYGCVHMMETMWEQADIPTFHRPLASDNGDVADDIVFFRASLADGVVATISSQGCVKTWCLDSLTLKLVVVEADPQATDPPVRLAVHHGRIAIGAASGKVTLYSALGTCERDLDFTPIRNTGVEIKKLFGIFFTEDGELLTCHGPSDVYSWCPNSGQLLKIYSFALCGRSQYALVPALGFQDDVFYLASTADYYLSAHNSGSVHAWDRSTGQLWRSFLGHTNTCTRVCVVDGPRSMILSSSFDGTVRLWDLRSGICLDVCDTGCPVVGMCVGQCLPKYAVVSLLDKSSTRCTGLRILKICDSKLKVVRKIEHTTNRTNMSNACCFFDGLRVLFTHEPATDRAGGQVDVVSLEFCPSDV